MIPKIELTDNDLINLKKKYYTIDTEESTTHPYTINNEKKIIKIFKPNINIDNKMKKIKLIKERTSNLDYVITADYIVTNNNKEIGYIMPYFNGEEISYTSNSNKNLKKNYIILKEISKDLKQLHDLGIITADFSENVLINNDNIIKFIDHDNFRIDNLDVDTKNILLKEYIKYFGKIDKNFDDYLLNLLTISVATRVHLYYLCDKNNIFSRKDENINNILDKTLHLDKINRYNEKLIIDEIDNFKQLKKIKLYNYF